MPSKCLICGLDHATLEELQELEREKMKPKEETSKKKSKKSSMSSYEDL